MQDKILELIVAYVAKHPEQIEAVIEKGGQALIHALLGKLTQDHAQTAG